MPKAPKKSPIKHLPAGAFQMLMAYAQALDCLLRCKYEEPSCVIIEIAVVKERRDMLISKFTIDYPGFNENAYYEYIQGICTDEELNIMEV